MKLSNPLLLLKTTCSKSPSENHHEQLIMKPIGPVKSQLVFKLYSSATDIKKSKNAYMILKMTATNYNPAYFLTARTRFAARPLGTSHSPAHSGYGKSKI